MSLENYGDDEIQKKSQDSIEIAINLGQRLGSSMGIPQKTTKNLLGDSEFFLFDSSRFYGILFFWAYLHLC